MSSAFQKSAFQWTPNKAFQIDAETAIKTGAGGIDPGDGLKRRIVKPTGLLHLPKKKGRIEERIDDTRSIQAEVAGRLAREFSEESRLLDVPQTIVEMTMAEIDAEIGLLLRKKLRTDEDEIALLLLMVAVTV